MAKTKSTQTEEARNAEREAVRAEIRAEREALYRARAPSAGSPRAEALALAYELEAAIHDRIHRLRADEGAEAAAEDLRRMRLRLERVQTEEDRLPGRLVPVLHAMRHVVAVLKGAGLHRRTRDVDLVARVRSYVGEELAEFSDAELLDVLRADNFNVRMAYVLTEHGYKMGASAVDRWVRGRKAARKRAKPH